MATEFDIPKRSAIIFSFTDIWMSEAEVRFTLWRRNTINTNVAADRLPVDIELSKGLAVNSQGSNNVYIKLDARMITQLPTYAKKLEQYFGQALVDGFKFDMYDSPFDDDVISVGGGTLRQLKLAFNPYDRIFSKYIKPTREVVVYCKWEVRKHGTAAWKLRAVGELQNAIDGGDVRWDHPRTDNPYLTRSYGNNKENDRETIWSLSFSHTAQIALGKIPARPTTNPNGTNSWYMPFFNLTPTATATANGAVSALPYLTIPPENPPPGALKIAQIVDDFRFLDAINVERRALWRRHISMGLVFKAWFDFAFGKNTVQEKNYEFICEDSPFEFRTAKLDTPQILPAGVNAYQASIDADPPWTYNKVNGHWNAPINQHVLMPQCLWGLYDEIACPAGDPIPLPQKTYASEHESAWETLLELCYCYGWVPTVEAVQNPKPTEPKVIIRFRAKTRKITEPRYTFVVPENAEPQQFPESEAGVEVTRRETFKNALDPDGEFDDWQSYRSTKFIPGGIFKRREPNPAIWPTGAENPAKLSISLVMGADAMWGFTFKPNRIHWYSTGYPNAPGGDIAFECERTERFPMFTPLMFSPNPDPDMYPILPPSVGIGEMGLPFRPIIGARVNIATELYPGGHDFAMFSWRYMLATYYSHLYNRAEQKYKITVPTVTEFTSAQDIKDKGEVDFDKKDVYYLTEVFLDEYYTHGFEEEWEEVKTTLELFKTRSLGRDIKDDPGGDTPVDHYQNTVSVNGVLNVTGALKDTVTVMPFITRPEIADKAEIKIGVGAFVPMSANEDHSGFYYDLDTTVLSNGDHTLTIKVTDFYGATSTKAVTIEVQN